MKRHSFIQLGLTCFAMATCFRTVHAKPAPLAEGDTTMSSIFAAANHLEQEFQSIPATNQEARSTATSMLSNLKSYDYRTVHINSETGRVYFADDPLPLKLRLKAEAEEKKRRTVPESILPSDQDPDSYNSNGLPILHSKPGAPNKYFLNFEGYQHQKNKGWPAFHAKPFDTAGNGIAFTSSEKNAVRLIWARIAEDYAPFNIDITTEDPGAFDASTGHCLITSTKKVGGGKMPEYNAGGVAYVGIFGDTDGVMKDYQPAIVYYDNLSNREDYTAEAASHEIGHNFGLDHDGKGNSEYYPGEENPSVAESWGPIMGTGYDNSVSQWSKGEYNGATNKQDDVKIIRDLAGSRADEAGSTIQSATAVSMTSATEFTAEGIISRDDDIDVWYVTVPAAGTLSVTVSPWKAWQHTAGANLNVKATLYDSAGNTLQQQAPSGSTGATITQSITGAGTYYIAVDGVKSSNHFNTDYGSLGQYTVSGSIPQTVCETTSDCPQDGLFCTPSLSCVDGQCVAGSDVCSSSQVCNEDTDSCDDKPDTTTTTSATTTTATAATTTTATTTTTTSNCVNDAYAPSSFNTPYEIEESTEAQLVFNGRMCRSDSAVDMFKVALCKKSKMTAKLQFNGDEADLDLYLALSNKNNVVATSLGFGDQETASVRTKKKAVDAFIRVQSFYELDETDYTLTLTFTDRSCFGDNDDDDTCTCPSKKSKKIPKFAKAGAKRVKYVMKTSCSDVGRTFSFCLARQTATSTPLSMSLYGKDGNNWTKIADSAQVDSGKGSSVCWKHKIEGEAASTYLGKGKQLQLRVDVADDTKALLKHDATKIKSC